MYGNFHNTAENRPQDELWKNGPQEHHLSEMGRYRGEDSAAFARAAARRSNVPYRPSAPTEQRPQYSGDMSQGGQNSGQNMTDQSELVRMLLDFINQYGSR